VKWDIGETAIQEIEAWGRCSVRRPRGLPRVPGVYVFLTAAEEVVYIGAADRVSLADAIPIAVSMGRHRDALLVCWMGMSDPGFARILGRDLVDRYRPLNNPHHVHSGRFEPDLATPTCF